MVPSSRGRPQVFVASAEENAPSDINLRIESDRRPASWGGTALQDLADPADLPSLRVPEGTVKVGGRDVRHDLSALRDAVCSAVPAEGTFLFSERSRRTCAGPTPRPPTSQIEANAVQACAGRRGSSSSCRGYDYAIPEAAATCQVLKPGTVYRRALLKNPKILILDDFRPPRWIRGPTR